MALEKNFTSKGIEPSLKIWRLFFFLSGIIATIAYRIIFLLNPFWVKIVWYIGTVCFTLYFGHRSDVEMKRAKLVKDYNLVKVIKESDINEPKKSALSYLIETSLTSKARFNSAFIFFASLIALIISLIIDIYQFVF
ncbi:MAG: hypothetical protein Q7S77_01050 [Candidatus Staskawiczbacteria bacterium]|nr:hypothetical protein [Candidatus Staskawiczbacteria bacterium]